MEPEEVNKMLFWQYKQVILSSRVIFERKVIFCVSSSEGLYGGCQNEADINSPKDMSSKGSDNPSLDMITFPFSSFTTLKAVLLAGHLGAEL